VSAFGEQKPQFWANFWHLGTPVLTPFYRWGPNLVCYRAGSGIRFRAKFRLDQFILSPSGGENPQILPFFGLRHFLVSPVSENLRKLNTVAQLQTFPYPTVLKCFLFSNALMAKSRPQTPTFKSVTEKHTDRQKTQRFWPLWRWLKSEPRQNWHGDRKPRARSSTSKTFGGPTHSFAASGRWKFWGNRPLNLKPHNSVTPWEIHPKASWNEVQTLQISWKSRKGYAPAGHLYSDI